MVKGVRVIFFLKGVSKKITLTPLISNFVPRTKIGLTFLEVIITLTLYAVAFLGLSQIFNVSLNTNKRVNQGVIATHLAQGLMAEIMAKGRIDPTDNATTLGPNGAGETGRSFFDDVDDYEAYTETPPRTLGGNIMDGTNNTPDYADFTRSVDVYYCQDVGNNIAMTGNNGNDVPTPPWKCANVTVSAPSMKTLWFVELKTQ